MGGSPRPRVGRLAPHSALPVTRCEKARRPTASGLVARLFRQLLGQSQYELVEAQTGHAAIALLEGSQYDAVLLDLRMPGGSGYDVLRAVARDDRHAHLPIVALTNYPTPGDAAERELLSSPVVIDLLSKPAVAARPQILLDRLQQLSGRSSPS